MKAQFIHIEDYSKNGFKKTTGKYKTEVKQSTIKGVCNEANRVKSFCSHVPVPTPPLLLYGVDLNAVEQLTEDYYNNTKATLKNGKTRALRKDSDALLAGVVSVPANFADWDKYKHDTINWLKNKYGDKLKCVVEHTDEPNPHLHFYVIQDPGLDFALVHDGRRAVLQSNEKDKKKQMGIYKKAMMQFNDDFYNAVSKKYDLTRKSKTPRPRISGTTEEYKEVVKQTQNLQKKVIETIEDAKKHGFRVGLAEFENNNVITKLNILNITKKRNFEEMDKQIKKLEKHKNYYKQRKDHYKQKTEKLSKEVKEFEQVVTNFYKPAYKKLNSIELENAELKKRNSILLEKNDKLSIELNAKTKMLDAVKKYFNKTWDNFINYFNNRNTAATNKYNIKQGKP